MTRKLFVEVVMSSVLLLLCASDELLKRCAGPADALGFASNILLKATTST